MGKNNDLPYFCGNRASIISYEVSTQARGRDRISKKKKKRKKKGKYEIGDDAARFKASLWRVGARGVSKRPVLVRRKKSKGLMNI